MADETKSFPPSELKLDRLRRQGLFPLSREVLSFAVVLGVLLGFTICGSLIVPALLDAASAALGAEGDPASVEGVRSAVAAAKRLFAAGAATLVLPVALGVLLAGLVQSKFLVAPGLASPSFSRLFQLDSLLPAAYRGHALRASARLLLTAAWLAAAGVLIHKAIGDSKVAESSPQVISQLFERTDAHAEGQPLSRAVARAGSELYQGWFAAAAFSFFAAVISYILLLIRFRDQHRMTRAEVEAEYREMEPAPEAREARDAYRLESETETETGPEDNGT